MSSNVKTYQVNESNTIPPKKETRTVVSEIISWEAMPLLLSSADTSKILGYSVARIRELCVAGIIPHIRLGRSFRIPKEALKTWVTTTSLETMQQNQPASNQILSQFRKGA